MCPELMDDRYNAKEIEGDAQYDISIHSGIDVSGNIFSEEIKKLHDISYVFVSLGDDELNVETAVNLRLVFEKMNISPIIHTVIHNPEKKEALVDLKTAKGVPYNIDFLGDFNSLYSDETMINSTLEKEALKRHMSWDTSKEEDFWAYEYNYRSSVASVIHRKMRIHCNIPGAIKPKEKRTDAEKDICRVLEHKRWNAYMRTEGWVYGKERNDMARIHHNLVLFDKLSQEDKEKDDD